MIDELDRQIEILEWKYAELALKPGWIDYVRYAVSQKQKQSDIYVGMGERVKKKIDILKETQ
jgi:hypothetical protein